jgi:SAM-dependent methyltransferase
MPGHWLLARLGKRVLRPGGVELTRHLLAGVDIESSDDVVEVAPGLGATTQLLLEAGPMTYTGVDRDPASADLVAALMDGPGRKVVQASAAETGLPDASADVVFGEAYLTMQPQSQKEKIVAELARVLRPGGRFALHEVAFAPDDIAPDDRKAVAAALTGSIKVNVSPLTVDGWEQLLAEHGLEIVDRTSAPLHLLEPRRLIADEGLAGAARFVSNVARDREARARVVAMRRAMRSNADHLQAIGLVAKRVDGATS